VVEMMDEIPLYTPFPLKAEEEIMEENCRELSFINGKIRFSTTSMTFVDMVQNLCTLSK
jgi:hypothetical protein